MTRRSDIGCLPNIKRLRLLHRPPASGKRHEGSSLDLPPITSPWLSLFLGDPPKAKATKGKRKRRRSRGPDDLPSWSATTNSPVVGSELPVWSIHGAAESYVPARDVAAPLSTDMVTGSLRPFHHYEFDGNGKQTKWDG